MGKNIRTIFKAFDYLHCDDFAKLLMDMAEQGWHFKEWGVGLKFEKGEPEQAVYAVEVFTDASEYDLRPEPNTTLNFAEYCKEAGWELVDAKRKFCIFKRVQETAVPILTQEERVQNAFKESKGDMIWPLIVAAMFVSMQLADYCNEHYFAERIFSAFELSITFLWGTLLIHRIVKLVIWLYQKNKMKHQLAAGEEVYLGEKNGKGKSFSHWSTLLVICTAVVGLSLVPAEWMIRMVIMSGISIGMFLLVSVLLAKFRPDSSTNYMIQTFFALFYVIVVFVMAICWDASEHEQVEIVAPLEKADYMEYGAEREDVIKYENSNILGSTQTYIVDYVRVDENLGNGLIYQIYSSEIDWIMDYIWEMETGKIAESEKLDCTKAWGAETAFLTGNEKYFVRYEDTIITFADYDGTILNQEQIDIICEKLDLR